MLKPDSIEQGNMLPILNMIKESSGFKIIALKYKRMSRDEAEKFYSIHSDKPFFNDLSKLYDSWSNCCCCILKKIMQLKPLGLLLDLLILTDAEEGTIRKKFAKSKGENAVHGSDSDENADIEISFHFERLSEIFS